ncbi:spore germination protein PB [Bacillus ectoiniformans]|uniref:spore germination protein GerPB n=1 Tax=Bacillus ectoiniformans TaxID=1494429 RepID=UPI00195AE7D0|nr:spore germination protein GerPB [Bacillus ectoiniformans]MBM7647576.1 spore germination protein PB [Bacillus ectoiniformans]
MNIYISQSINIRYINIGSVSNSSMLQIGTAGSVTPASYLFNTGRFTGPAPSANGQTIITEGSESTPAGKEFLVPLQSPT